MSKETKLEPCICGHAMLIQEHPHYPGKHIVRCGSDGKDCIWFPSSGPIEESEIPKYITTWNTRTSSLTTAQATIAELEAYDADCDGMAMKVRQLQTEMQRYKQAANTPFIKGGTCNTTHSACDCVIQRTHGLEAQLHALKEFINDLDFQSGCSWCERNDEARKEIEE